MKQLLNLSCNFKRCLIKTIVIVSVFFLGLILVGIAGLIYLGPYTTYKVQHNLQHYPQEIIVALTTTPYRIDKIKPVLDSIFRQSIKPTRVYVNVPWKFKREDKAYVIPHWLKVYPNIIINRTIDYGPATKIIATLTKEEHPETIIITLDDDKIYAKHVVRDLIRSYLIVPSHLNYKNNAAITGSGYMLWFDRGYHIGFKHLVLGDRPSAILAGHGGVAYKRRFFHQDVFSLFNNLPTSCFLSDDLMISAYLLTHKISIVKLASFTYNPLTDQLWDKIVPVSPVNALPQANLLRNLGSMDFSVTFDALSLGAAGVGGGSNSNNYAQCLAFLANDQTKHYYHAILNQISTVNRDYYAEIERSVVVTYIYKFLYYIIDLFRLQNIVINFLS